MKPFALLLLILILSTPTISGSFQDWLQIDAAVSLVGTPYWINDNAHADSRIIDLGRRLTVWRRDQTGRCANGSLVAAWNAWACPIP